MIKVKAANMIAGSEVRVRDYSEPLQAQRELPSWAAQIVMPIDVSSDLDYANLAAFENELIRIWRNMARNPYIDFAIDDIVNEMLSYKDEQKYPIALDLNDTNFSENIRKKIHDEWIYIMKLLVFHKKSFLLLKDWYIDGKQYFFLKIGNRGINEIVTLDPCRVKKIIKEDESVAYIYQDVTLKTQLMEIPESAIVELNSGIMDDKHMVWVSYLNKAYVPLNQLQNIEDALLIYRIARAPERRVFYIDTGALPKSKAMTYMQEVIRTCRNRMEFDPKTGKISEASLHMSLLDDIYLPRSAEGRGTEVSTLQGGNSSFSQLDDLDYFKIKLFRSLNVPFTRWSEMNGPAGLLGRSQEITRDEVKYRKFIVRLRNIYNGLFFSLLRTQLSLKKIVSEKEFNAEYENIMFDWSTDSDFAELRDLEILTERLNIFNLLLPNVGVYFSKAYMNKKILRFTDAEIAQMEQEMEEEKKAGVPLQPAGMDGMGMGM